MCGLVGTLSPSVLDESYALNVLKIMSDRIVARGPNDYGCWFNKKIGLGFAHRRLSINDLSSAGHQPMLSPGGRFVIVYNGEVYNHLELRKYLEAMASFSHSWRSHSDTETLLCSFDLLGIEATLNICVGMFAFAVWDNHKAELILARDRFGEKPLYYGWQGRFNDKVFLFGSDIKALSQHPKFDHDINRNAVSSMLMSSVIGGNLSIYNGIYKLDPGCLLVLNTKDFNHNIVQWWSASSVVNYSVANRFAGDQNEASLCLENILRETVSNQMLADVPVGAFLSGGVDSSLIVAIMQQCSSRPIKTFSVGFEEGDYNEAAYAKLVAKSLGTDHTEMYLTSNDALALIPKLPEIYSEPFADSSQIPTFLVSQLAKNSVTVALTGDAGDELFCGYNRYLFASSVWNRISSTPLVFRNLIAKLLLLLPPKSFDELGKLFTVKQLGNKLQKISNILGCGSSMDLYSALVTEWKNPESIVIGCDEPLLSGHQFDSQLVGLEDVEKMMYYDTVNYIPNDILVKTDRAAMGISLETRTPFLDHRIFQFAWSLPLEYKYKSGISKIPLRNILYQYVPKELIERPKMGFGVPLDRWLRGPMRDWAEDLLSPERLSADGFFNVSAIREKWKEHLSGRRNCHTQLWSVLMFQNWLDSNKR